jgi:hypothetical protein
VLIDVSSQDGFTQTTRGRCGRARRAAACRGQAS